VRGTGVKSHHIHTTTTRLLVLPQVTTTSTTSTVLGAGSSTSTCTCTNTVLLVSTGTTGLELLAALELVLHLFAGFAQLPLHRPGSPLMRPLLMKPG
jgi:hypothetical protein